MVRTVLTWRILGENLVGTCHVPTPGRAGGLSGAPSVGILLLNAGPAQRSGNSDLSVRIGDRLALRGFPVFRFDLSGLGDSSGPTPPDLDAYWTEVIEGRNDEATVALIERIQHEFGVARVIVGGLCAAALPSVRALGRGQASPAGLILLEPNFMRAVQRQADGTRIAAPRSPLERCAAFLRRGAVAVGLRGPMLALRRRLRRGFPRDVNEPLVARWRKSFADGVRSVVVVAEEKGTDRYVTQILAAMPERAPGAVSCVRVPRTNHLFTGGSGRDAVLEALERWVIECFGGRVEPGLWPSGRI